MKNFKLLLTLLMTIVIGTGTIWATDYQLVTSTGDLEAGAHYVIGTPYNSNNYFMATDNNANNRKLTTATVSNGKVTATASMMTFTLGGDNTDGWTFLTDNYGGTDDGYLNATSTTGNNYLKVVTELDDYAYFSIELTAEGVATITCKGKTSRNIMYLNGTTCFACYNNQTGSQYVKPRLYKEVPAGDNPSVSGAPASIDFGSVLEKTIGEDDTEHVMQHFTLTGANLTDDVEFNIEATGGGSIFFLNGYKSSITLSPEAGAINYAVYVIASTSNVGPFTGTLTISSQASTPDFADIVVPLSINVIEPVTSYNIDFETNALSAYANWNFSNIAIVSTAISAHAGTYYGNTDGKTTASITTKEKIALPGTLTFYISKESTNTTESYWKAQVSEDGSAWTNVEDFDAKGMDKGIWNECQADLSDYSNVYVRISYGNSGAIRAIDDISLEMRTPAAVEKPVISGQTPFYKNTHVTIDCLTDGATIYYTLDGSEPDPDDFGGATNTYDASGINLVNTTTINAIAVKGSDRTETVSKTFTKATVMTVAEALTTIDALADNGKTAEAVYVVGYVKSITEIAAGGYTNATYLIQDKGVNNELTVFRGRNIDDTDFTSADQLAVGDSVVIVGYLQKYVKSGTTTPEVTQGNYIVERKTSAGLAWEDAEASAYTMGKSNSYQTLTNPNSVVVTYSGDNDAVATVASDGTISLVAPGDVTVTASFAGDASYLPAEVSYTLHVYAPSTLVITGSATKTAYDIGDAFDREGLIATVAYDDGQTWEATAVCLWTVNPLFISNSTNHVDVTAEWQEAGLTSSPFQQDITINTYVITFDTPSNGTLVIRDEYDDPISSGESYPKGFVFTVEATPNSGYQLATLTANGDDIKDTKSFTVGTEDISVTATFAEIVYSVVGPGVDYDGIFPKNWDPADTETEMTLNEGVYSYTLENVTLQASVDYAYKIVKGHTWGEGHEYPASGNATFSVAKDGKYNVTFTLNPSTGTYNANPELIQEIAVNRKFAVAGDFNSWSTTPVELTPDAAIASITISNLTKGDYAFKVIVNGAWLGNGEEFTRANNSFDITTNGSDNMTLHVDVPGDYVFTWTYETNKLEITYPAKPALPMEWSKKDGYTITYGENIDESEYSRLMIAPSLQGLEITVTSDAPEIASYNSKGYAVDGYTVYYDIHKAGVATITASFAGNEDYAETSVSYTLTVNKGDSKLEWSTTSFNADVRTDAFDYPELSFAADIDVSKITYSSDNTEVATVDADGKVTLLQGDYAVLITATFAGDDKYENAEASYWLSTEKVDPVLSWSESTASATIGESNEFPTLNNEDNVPVTYSSDNDAAVYINPQTGEITLLQAGEFVISADFAGNGLFNSAHAEYTLTVAGEAVEEDLLLGLDLSSYEFEINAGEALPKPSVEAHYSLSGNIDVTADATFDGVFDNAIAGTYTINVSYNDGNGQHAEATYTVKVKDTATAIGNAEMGEKAVKVIENNQLIIIKNGVKYTISGSKIR